MFNGGAARYGDINANLTFRRDLSGIIETQLAEEAKPVAYILGPAGFGKSTIARQVVSALSKRSYLCWEHRTDYRFDVENWIKIADYCQSTGINALLLVDEAHSFLRQLDSLFDHIYNKSIDKFRLVLVSSPARWHPRTKSPSLYQISVEYSVGRLSHGEITSLLDLFERRSEISSLVEAAFSGFSRNDKLRRLSDRCRSDMFVCMKNIFGFDKLDDIILKEYSEIDENLQNIYRTVAAMEASQIRVHRQLVMRILGIKAGYVDAILTMLKDIVEEYTVDEKNGIYAWRGRHPIISDIILKYKYNDQERLFELYSHVINYINPTYEIEQLTIREMCDIREGIGRLSDRSKQNHLYRKLISVAPAQRVPRHRLINNLITDGDYEPASNEIRIFENELRTDPPIIRYKAMILIARSRKSAGLMNEDRVVMLEDAKSIVSRGLDRFGYDRSLHSTNLDIGLDIFKLRGDWSVFDAAMGDLVRAEQQYLDPEMNQLISRYRLRAEGIARGDN
ncbi:P-loop NTPase [Methylorubrum aminovorans]